MESTLICRINSKSVEYSTKRKKESHKIKEAFVSIQQMFIPLTSLIKNFWFGRVLIFLFILGAIVNRMIKACHCYRFLKIEVRLVYACL